MLKDKQKKGEVKLPEYLLPMTNTVQAGDFLN